MKYRFLITTLSFLFLFSSLSQNPSFSIIFDSIYPLVKNGKYTEARGVWIETEKEYAMDQQEKALFLQEALLNGTITCPDVKRIHKMSKIIACEAKIVFYNSLEGDGENNRFEMERFELNKILANLTGNFEPEFCIPKIINGVPF